MEQMIVIEGRLDGLNEIIASSRSGWKTGAREKKDLTEWCRYFFLAALKDGRVSPITGRADIDVTWYEFDRRRDHDNILAGLKFILDGAVRAGVLPDDSQKYIRDIHSTVKVDKKNPRVEVRFVT